MNIKRYEDEIYGPSSYDFEESESGSWVKYEDHASEVARLNEQVQALTAENLAMRELLGAVGYKSEFKATDAILKEVRAQGVDGFAAEMYRVANEHVANGRSKKYVVQCRTAAKAAEDYAARIRAGEVHDA